MGRVMTGLCRTAVSLYPREFRREFGEEIVASFELHYSSLGRSSGRGGTRTLVTRQLADIADLAMSAWRFRREKGAVDLGSDVVMSMTGKFMIRSKLFFAWQLEEEAAFLEEMSVKGWHFVEYTLGVYLFRRLDLPKPYKFTFLRYLFGTSEERLAFIETKEEDGWEFFKYWWGWYYFRRPAA